MIRETLTTISQNKNFLMLISVVFYIVAWFATLTESLLIISFLLTAFMLISVIKGWLSPKLVMIWTLIFYFGVINTTFRVKSSDELLNLAPRNSVIKGTVISIPQGWSENKPKFYFDVKEMKKMEEVVTLFD